MMVWCVTRVAAALRGPPAPVVLVGVQGIIAVSVVAAPRDSIAARRSAPLGLAMCCPHTTRRLCSVAGRLTTAALIAWFLSGGAALAQFGTPTLPPPPPASRKPTPGSPQGAELRSSTTVALE